MYTRSHMPWMQFAYANIIIYHGHSTPSSIGKVLHEMAHIHHGIQDNQPGGSALNSLTNAHCTQQIRLFSRFAHIQRCMCLFFLSRWPEFSFKMSEWQKRKDNFCFCFWKVFGIIIHISQSIYQVQASASNFLFALNHNYNNSITKLQSCVCFFFSLSLPVCIHFGARFNRFSQWLIVAPCTHVDTRGPIFCCVFFSKFVCMKIVYGWNGNSKKCCRFSNKHSIATNIIVGSIVSAQWCHIQYSSVIYIVDRREFVIVLRVFGELSSFTARI